MSHHQPEYYPEIPKLFSAKLPLVIKNMPLNKTEAKKYIRSQLESMVQHIGFNRDLLLADLNKSKNNSYCELILTFYALFPLMNYPIII